MTRFSMKKKVGTAIATMAVAVTMLVVPAQAASACTIVPVKNSSSVSITKENDCIGDIDKVQARMQRYGGGTITTLYGPEGVWSSMVKNSNGTLAGAHYRTLSTISKKWTPYIAF